jgi:CRISPR system Cascade subunit CasA
VNRGEPIIRAESSQYNCFPHRGEPPSKEWFIQAHFFPPHKGGFTLFSLQPDFLLYNGDMKYNLRTNPFIPIIGNNGIRQEVSLTDALLNAHEISEIESDPLITASLNRLLIALVLAIYRSTTPKEKFDTAIVAKYFEKWKDRFDLYDENYPFYQVSRKYIEKITKKPPIWSVSKLLLVDDNTPTIFSHIMDSDETSMTSAEVARWLITHQTFAPCGNPKAKPFPFTAAPVVSAGGGMIYLVRGNNLFETICLNLTVGNMPKDKNDMPCWERTSIDMQVKEGIAPTGPLNLLTWQVRWAHLIPENNLTVKHWIALRGDAIDSNTLDPMSEYFRKDGNTYARKFSLQRSSWRDYYTLIANLNSDLVARRPMAVEALKRRGGKEFQKRFSIDVFGIQTNKAKVFGWKQESWPLPEEWIDNPGIHGLLKDVTEYTETGWGYLFDGLGKFAAEMYDNKCKDEIKAIKKRLGDESSVLYWSNAEQQFVFLMDTIINNPEQMDNWRTTWARMLRKVILSIYRNVTSGHDAKGTTFKAYTQGLQLLQYKLASLGPKEETDE